jgi:gas vesicle protein
MTDSNQGNKQMSTSAFVAGAAGAMLGAAAGAAAIVLTDERNREKVARKGSHLLHKAKKGVDQFMQPDMDEKTSSVKNKANSMKQDLLEVDTPVMETHKEV